MTRNLVTGKWGWGGAVCAPADEGRGGAGVAGAGEVAADALVALDAAEAIASLESPDQSRKLEMDDPDYFPGPIAKAFYYDDADIVAIQGPVGSGKTRTLFRSRMRRAIMMPRSTRDGWRRYKMLIVRETYRQLWATTIPSYLEVFPKALGTWTGGRGAPVQHTMQFSDGFGPIEIIAEFMAFGDDIIASMRGLATTDIVINEADTNPPEVLTAGIGRIDRWPSRGDFDGYAPELRSYGQIVCDLNAPDEDNWTFQVFHDEAARKAMAEEMTEAVRADGALRGETAGKAVRIEFYNQPGYGQPGCENLGKLSPSYYPRQIAAMRLAGRGDMIDRLIFNKITYLRTGDPVFQREFNPRIHVAESPIAPVPGQPLIIGLDQGFKGAAVVAQFQEPFHLVVLAELHFPKERLMAAEFGRRLAQLLERRFPNHSVEGAWGDMAGEQGASQAADENATWNKLVATAAGISVRPQRIGTNRIQPRLEAIRAMLEFIHGGRPGLLLDPSCKFLHRGFQARYVWKDEVDANGDKRKIPDKSQTEANVVDALQYLALSLGPANGLSRISFPDRSRIEAGAMSGFRRGAPAQDSFSTGYNILNPYGA
jgi:hypothetical protein